MRPLVLLLLALPAAAQVRLELRAREPGERFAVEQLGDAGTWRRVAELTECETACTWEARRASPAARFRVRAIDPSGNEGPPAEVGPTTPPPEACTWLPEIPAGRPVPVDCVGACQCTGALERLDSGLSELLRWRLTSVEEVGRVLPGLRIVVAPAKDFGMGGGVKAEGYYDPERHTVVLSEDASAALHEVLHAIHVVNGIDVGGDGHGPWKASSLLAEVDDRFRAKFRGRSLWARPRR